MAVWCNSEMFLSVTRRLPQFAMALALAVAVVCSGGSFAYGKDANARQQALDAWRALTRGDAAPPEVYVLGTRARFLFAPTNPSTKSTPTVFSANWRMPRRATKWFNVTTAVLSAAHDDANAKPPSTRWRKAAVIAGSEWQQLSRGFLEALAPTNHMEGSYYQAFLADGVVYRDANGRAGLASLSSTPEGVSVQNQFSLEETLEKSADYFTRRLQAVYPNQTLFVLMAPHPRRLATPMLLDTARKRCVWLIPAPIQAAAEQGGTVALTWEAFSALVLESHGLALLKNPVSSAIRLVDMAAMTAGRLSPLRLPKLGSQAPPLSEVPLMDMEDWETWLDSYTGTRRVGGELNLLIDGEQFFTRIDQNFASATNDIRVQMFIFDRDDVAVGVADQLREKSKSVSVRVLHDRLGTMSGGLSPPASPLPAGFVSPASIGAYLENESHVKVRATLNPWLSHNHTKIILVDNATAWLGGMNFGREYRFEWHDAMVELQGPVVRTLSDEFERCWAHAGPLGDAAYLRRLLTSSTNPRNPPQPGEAGVRLLPTRTGWKPFAAASYGVMRHTRRYLFVENPYLFDKRAILGLAHARARGVDVRVILPRVNDFKAGERASMVVANWLLANGVRVYLYPGMTHTKALLADGWACLGSANMNHFSMRLNHEQNVATADPAFVADVRKRLFDADFKRSIELKEPVAVDWTDLVTNLLLEGP